ncbi:MAG: glycoside hydrolase family 127 protein [Phycisphaerae bacterium]|nr:glycoside hydrolase family 127 protein [Phycisphaerae bacterium]
MFYNRVSGRSIILLITGIIMVCSFQTKQAKAMTADVVEKPDTQAKNDFYVGNREPLLASPFIKLPAGAIEPQGWIRKQLELEADGFIGHLDEISQYVRKQNNPWLDPKANGTNYWEAVPYWLKGFCELGYLLNDKRIIDESQQWLEAIFASQREDGWFGPEANFTSLNGKPDMWPNMLVLNGFRSYYEYTGDERVIPVMTKYFRWQMSLPDNSFLSTGWHKVRANENLGTVHWLYNHTGEKWLLDLAERTNRNTMDWKSGLANLHGVNIAQCFRGPAEFYPQSKDLSDLAATERNYQTVMDIYGQVPGGMYGADENCHPGNYGPSQAVETCAVADMMHSDEILLRVTGDPKWADRCENAAFNTLPATMTPDLKGLHYLTAPNMIQCDISNKNPRLQDNLEMLIFDPHRYRCCQHNVSHAWPFYAANLWMATPGNGLAVVMYAPSKVTAKVGDGTAVTVVEETNYPFDENIQLTLSTAKPVSFPLYLRVPGWCKSPIVKVNGKAVSVKARPLSYILIDRKWSDGDKVSLGLPMEITLTTWKKNKDSVSVNRGPLTYSLKIGEKYVRLGGTDKWPAWEVYPTTDWNYGLVLNEKDPASSFEVVRKKYSADTQPFEVKAAPIELRVKAKKIPAWRMDAVGMVGRMQQSPVKSNKRTETVSLIPMGCGRLRISAFPTIGSGPDAQPWSSLAQPISSLNNDIGLNALCDGIVPERSDDKTVPHFEWIGKEGTKEWVQIDFNRLIKINTMEVFWYDDSDSGGNCRVPKSWKASYVVPNGFRSQPRNGSSYSTIKNQFNNAMFDQVETTSIRLEVELQPGCTAGILEWRILNWGEDVRKVQDQK